MASSLPELCIPPRSIGLSSSTSCQSDYNHDGDENPVWTVYVGNDEEIPVDLVYTCLSFGAAERPTRRIAEARRLERITDATPTNCS